MKAIKIAAGLAHVDYGHLADIVREASVAGADYIHSDAADMDDLRNMQLMGGYQVIEGIRGATSKPIECHAYVRNADKHFVEAIAQAGANLLILPAESYLGAELAYIIRYCRNLKLKLGLAIGCFTPLLLVEEAIYELDRLHIIVHGVNDDRWMWRASAIPLIERAKELIAQRNPGCELALDGGIRADNLGKLVATRPDVMVFSSAIFKHPEGITAGLREVRTAIEAASRFDAAS